MDKRRQYAIVDRAGNIVPAEPHPDGGSTIWLRRTPPMQNADTLAALWELAAFARTAPGRLPQRVQDALVVADAALAERETVKICPFCAKQLSGAPVIYAICDGPCLATPEPAERCAPPICRGDGWHRHESYGKRPCPFYPATPQPSAERERIAEIIYEFAPVKTEKRFLREREVIPFAELIERKRRPFLAAADRILAERKGADDAAAG